MRELFYYDPSLMVVQYAATMHSVRINVLSMEFLGILVSRQIQRLMEALALMLLTPSRYFIEARMSD